MRLRLVLALGALAACRGEPTAPPILSISALDVIPVTAAGASVGDSIRVRVVDDRGNPRSGILVSFAATAGGGSVSPAAVTTDGQGRAAARFTTGTTVGSNTATASIPGSASVSFTLTTVAGYAASLSVKERIVFIDVGQRFTATITAADVYGNVVPATQISLEARTPNLVSVSSDFGVTGNFAGQTQVVASNGSRRDSVLVVVTTPNGPVLQSDLTRLDLPRDTTFTVPIVLDMRTSTEKLGATTVTVRWDPGQLVFVSHAEGSSGVGAVVNATAVAQGTLTLATASVSGFAGRIELRRLTFRTVTTSGTTGTLRLSASEVSAAGTFASLLPRTAMVSYPLSIR